MFRATLNAHRKAAEDDEVDVVELHRVGARKGIGLERVETDGRFFCVTWDREEKPIRTFMQAGTYLKAEGKMLVSSDQPATLALEVEESAL